MTPVSPLTARPAELRTILTTAMQRCISADRDGVLYVDAAPTGCSLVWTGDIWTVRHCATGQIHGRGTTEAAAVRMFVEGRA